LVGAKTALARIDECVGKLREIGVQVSIGSSQETFKPELQPHGQFSTALDADLSISAAWAVVFDWIREMNKRIAENSLTAHDAAIALTSWDKIDSVLGIGAKSEMEIPAEILALLEARQAARKTKDFRLSDAIRGELKAKGWIIEDTPKGPKLKKI
jgi:cysteinyl-tRNA synthetase